MERKSLSCYLHTGYNIKFYLKLYILYYTYSKNPSFLGKFYFIGKRGAHFTFGHREEIRMREMEFVRLGIFSGLPS